MLEIELTRAEKRFKKDPAARNADQTINRGKTLTPDGKEVILEPPKPLGAERPASQTNGNTAGAPASAKAASVAPPISTKGTSQKKPAPVTPPNPPLPSLSSPPPLAPAAPIKPTSQSSGHEKADTHHVRQAIQQLHQATQRNQSDDERPEKTRPLPSLPQPDVESEHPLLRGQQDRIRTPPSPSPAPIQVESKPPAYAPQRTHHITPPASPDSPIDFEELLQARYSRTWPQTPPSPARVRVEAPIVLDTYGLPEKREKPVKKHANKTQSYSQQAPHHENRRISKPPSAHANSFGVSRILPPLEPPPLLYDKDSKDKNQPEVRSKTMPSVMKMLRRGSWSPEKKSPLNPISAKEDDLGNESRGIGRIRRSFTMARPRRSESQSGKSTS